MSRPSPLAYDALVDRGPLGDDVDRFIGSVCGDLSDLSHKPSTSHQVDVVVEAGCIVAAALR